MPTRGLLVHILRLEEDARAACLNLFKLNAEALPALPRVARTVYDAVELELLVVFDVRLPLLTGDAEEALPPLAILPLVPDELAERSHLWLSELSWFC